MASNDNPSDGPNRPRRGSFTQQTFTSIFGGRSNSMSGNPTAPFPGPITTATGTAQDQRRRMSINTLGLSGTSPSQASPFPFGARRASVSTAGSGSIDENAIDDDDGPPASTPNTPFARRISFGAPALRRAQPNGRPRSEAAVAAHEARGGRVTPPSAHSQTQASTQSKPRTASDYPVSARSGAEGNGFNWSEQLRSRAESSVSQSQRPSFSTSPNTAKPMGMHERTKSVSDMSAPPSAVPPPAHPPPRPARKQPDAFQERILKGDFYMD
ncbi:hypothetical protein BJ875DRAFT_415996 [Amylocarpus encephaloides]|uniref:Uncharacterized protein n=1 Tax=Amylocarpus encephaloides TaxID=45428 RepID=A0A9P8C982_9HELO|nr:hypothetical protein BJ875DRAFT_415996 [Amylocarpus encephaloides]